MTKKKIEIIGLACGILFMMPVIGRAELDQPYKNFPRSKIAAQYKIFLDQTIDTGPFSTTPGSQQRIYLSKDRRYTFELLTDKKTQIIHLEKLTFIYNPGSSSLEDDKNCALHFINEASGGKINTDEFLIIYNKALKNIGIKQIKKINGFSITVFVYHHAISSECEITVTKT